MTTLAAMHKKLVSMRSSAGSRDLDCLDLLLREIELWRESDEAPGILDSTLERTLGQTRFSSQPLQREVNECLLQFRVTVHDLPGMTMNERLVMFDLVDRWDRGTAEGRAALYKKLLARP